MGVLLFFKRGAGELVTINTSPVGIPFHVPFTRLVRSVLDMTDGITSGFFPPLSPEPDVEAGSQSHERYDFGEKQAWDVLCNGIVLTFRPQEHHRHGAAQITMVYTTGMGICPMNHIAYLTVGCRCV